jgi:hypothetical protein
MYLSNTLQNNIGDLDTNNPFVKADLEGNLAKVSHITTTNISVKLQILLLLLQVVL